VHYSNNLLIPTWEENKYDKLKKAGRNVRKSTMERAKVNRYIQSSAFDTLPGFDLSSSPTFDVNQSNFTTKKQQSKATKACLLQVVYVRE
jgi:hypothetical protein